MIPKFEMFRIKTQLDPLLLKLLNLFIILIHLFIKNGYWITPFEIDKRVGIDILNVHQPHSLPFYKIKPFLLLFQYYRVNI